MLQICIKHGYFILLLHRQSRDFVFAEETPFRSICIIPYTSPPPSQLLPAPPPLSPLLPLLPLIAAATTVAIAAATATSAANACSGAKAAHFFFNRPETVFIADISCAAIATASVATTTQAKPKAKAKSLSPHPTLLKPVLQLQPNPTS